MRKILIVGGGYAGFYTAWRLEKWLRPGEAQLTVVDPRPYMTYQPFLPEVAVGSIEARHAAISLRRHLRRTTVIAGRVTRVDHRRRKVTIQGRDAPAYELAYEIIVITAGAVTRRFPIPGLDTEAIGLKHVEEAVAIRDHVLVSLDRAAGLTAGPERDRLLTVTMVGGGFTGVEGFGEILSLATDLVASYPGIRSDNLRFHLVEAQSRLMPEVSATTADWVRRSLEDRGAQVHLNTQLVSAVGGHVVLSTGDEYDSGLIVWAAGNAANPLVANHTDLPIDRHGLLKVRADLRVGSDSAPVPDAWGAGDNAAVPDLRGRPGARAVPNAQHAVRQGKHLAANIIATLRGQTPTPYRHRNLGVVATLGFGHGVFQAGPIVIRGVLAWLMHRGYHVLAVPTWERKVRVSTDWLPALIYGRDIVSLESVQHPRSSFLETGAPDDARP